jgi:SAM-dependent methyltransferase
MRPWNQRVYYELLRSVVGRKRWLDVGCGRPARGEELGRVTVQFSPALAVGVDCDMDALGERHGELIARADAEKLPFGDATFDIVSSNMVFEHLSDPSAVLSEMRRVLAPGGLVVIHAASCWHAILLAGRTVRRVVGGKNYARLVRGYSRRDHADIYPTLYRASSAGRLAKLAEASGLVVIAAGHLRTPPSFPSWLRPAEALLPGRMKSTLILIAIRLG